jgi:hypothetical protein
MNILNTSTQFLNDIKTVVSVQQCFEKLKLALCTAPILAYPKLIMFDSCSKMNLEVAMG